jgi:hypothetical protein
LLCNTSPSLPTHLNPYPSSPALPSHLPPFICRLQSPKNPPHLPNPEKIPQRRTHLHPLAPYQNRVAPLTNGIPNSRGKPQNPSQMRGVDCMPNSRGNPLELHTKSVAQPPPASASTVERDVQVPFWFRISGKPSRLTTLSISHHPIFNSYGRLCMVIFYFMIPNFFSHSSPSTPPLGVTPTSH